MVYEMLLFDGRACFQLERFFTGFKKKQKKLSRVHAYMYKLVSHIIAVRELFEYVKLML